MITENQMIIENQIVGQVDVPNVNGRIYKKEVMEKALASHGDRKLWLYNPSYSSNGIPIHNIAGCVKNVRIEENSVIGDIHVFESPMGIILKGLIESDAELRYYTVGTGILDKELNVSEYCITGIGYE